jgi:phenylacetate-coenzyme A ligase PaaK-like adenylate-forming protein
MIPSVASSEELLRQLVQATHSRVLWTERARAIGESPINALIDHATRTVPFYQNWASVNKTGDLLFQNLPVIAKTDIRKDADAFRSAKFPPEVLHWETTSGTTGVPLKICYDPASRYYDMYEIYSELMNMIPCFRDSFRKGGTLIAIINDNVDRVPFTAIHPTLEGGIIHRLIIGKSDAEDERLILQLRETHVPLLCGRPRAIVRLQDLDASIAAHANTIRPQVILTAGDNLHSNVKDRLMSWFSCSIHNAYASQEAGVIGVHCGHPSGGIHIIRDAAIVEVRTEDGELHSEGSGEMVVTNLTNWAMPFLRYLTGDAVTFKSYHRCACGRSGSTITELSGRDSVYFMFDGDRYNPSLLNPIFESFPIDRFQVIQETDKSLHVLLVIAAGVLDGEGIMRTVRERIDQEIRGAASIGVERVFEIGRRGEKVQRYVRKIADEM